MLRVLLAVLGAGALLAVYAAGVRRLTRRGVGWPGRRAVSWAAGTVVAAATAVAPVPDRFSGRVVEHLLLGMVAPALLVVGRPVTLALRSGDGLARRVARALTGTGPAHRLVHPALAALLFALGPWVLWLTPLYDLEGRSGPVHGAVHLHLLLSGALFAVAVLGIEPTPWRRAHGLRLLAAAAVLPVHAVLGMVLLSGDGSLNPHLPVGEAVADQRLGGGLVWAIGDGLATVALLLVASQWAASDRRAPVPHAVA